MSFINSPENFKPNLFSLTEYRIKLVIKYIIYCHLKMKRDGKKYKFLEKGKLQKEDFLRNGLVDDYLAQKDNKEYYKQYISDNPNVEIYFQKEENQVYSNCGKLADDYIDISIKENKLSEILSGESGDEIKFAVECKRIKVSNDYTEYIKDIQKFADRKFTTYRLAYEGQIAFIENSSLSYSKVSDEINKKLKKTISITTLQHLTKLTIYNSFDSSYSSTHLRNHGENNRFSIFHLLMDYSEIVA